MNLRPHLAVALLASTAFAAPAFAGNYETISQSIISLKGIPSSKGTKSNVAAAAQKKDDVVAVSSPVKTMTAEERRLLRYGVAEENKKKLSEASRDTDAQPAAADPAATEMAAMPAVEKPSVNPSAEPETKTIMVPITQPEEEAVVTPVAAPSPEPDDGETTIIIAPETDEPASTTVWKSAADQKPDVAGMAAQARAQDAAEAPKRNPPRSGKRKPELPKALPIEPATE